MHIHRAYASDKLLFPIAANIKLPATQTIGMIIKLNKNKTLIAIMKHPNSVFYILTKNKKY
ncbi:hypothetical protein CW697_09225 [Macrococcoides caseolyticum]|nr:hypothetical protein CW668_08615 [Macrococcus caseolyticus]PKF29235.1 hypothetical protein CW697_09225 [Macrococcus caseolyticus]